MTHLSRKNTAYKHTTTAVVPKLRRELGRAGFKFQKLMSSELSKAQSSTRFNLKRVYQLREGMERGL